MNGSRVAVEPFDSLRHAGGRPTGHALLKQEYDDFQVDEIAGFAFTGGGEHLCVKVRKTDLTTTELARRIARVYDVSAADVGYAGMKDKRAICTQWYSIRKPGRTGLDPQLLQDELVQVIQVAENSRKIQIGSHKGNSFRIRLRSVSGPRQEIEQRLDTIAAQGVPNYYGAQRFGHAMNNVHEALAVFGAMSGAEAPPSQRYSLKLRMLVSAARAYLFNQVLSHRVAEDSWAGRLPGEVFNLDGTARFFSPRADEDGAVLDRRLAELDIHGTGPLAGRLVAGARYQPGAAVAALESEILARHGTLHRGLLHMGLEASRRSLRLAVRNLQYSWPQADTLELGFELAAGGYATSVLRELCNTTVPDTGRELGDGDTAET